jgi:hypothetical protein
VQTTYTICAGTIDHADRDSARWYKPMRQRTPAERLPTPQDIVSAVFFILDTRHGNSANLLDAAGMHHS